MIHEAMCCQQTWITGNTSEGSLGSENCLRDRNLELHKEIKSATSGVIGGNYKFCGFFLIFIACTDNWLSRVK